jgi:hypothetical protein
MSNITQYCGIGAITTDTNKYVTYLKVRLNVRLLSVLCGVAGVHTKTLNPLKPKLV